MRSFIGFHLCQQLPASGAKVVGIDNLIDYYYVQLKKDRLWQFEQEECFFFVFA